MKKTNLAVTAAVLAGTVVLTACGGGQKAETTAAPTTAAETTAEETTAEETAEAEEQAEGACLLYTSRCV